MHFHLIYVYVLILSTFVYGVLTIRRDAPLPYRLLMWLMIATLPTETTAVLVGHYYHINHWVYNIWAPIECAVILLVFYKGTVHPVTREVCGWLLVLLPLGTVVFYLPHFNFLTLNTHEMVFTLFCELISGCVFLVDGLLWGEELSIFRRPLSWMAFGTILYTCVFILTHALWEYILVGPIWHYELLVIISNTFQYGGFLLTFIALRKSQRPRQSITA